MAVFVAQDQSGLTLKEVKNFLLQKGGRATNHELVSQFRKFLNDPLHQVEARLQFKDIVNTIASVKEDQGVKYITLKKKYQEASVSDFNSDESSLDTSATSTYSNSTQYNSPYSQSFQPYWRYRLSSDTNREQPVLLTGARKLSSESLESSLPAVIHSCSSPNLCESASVDDQKVFVSLGEPIYESMNSKLYQTQLNNEQHFSSLNDLNKKTNHSQKYQLDTISDTYLDKKQFPRKFQDIAYQSERNQPLVSNQTFDQSFPSPALLNDPSISETSVKYESPLTQDYKDLFQAQVLVSQPSLPEAYSISVNSSDQGSQRSFKTPKFEVKLPFSEKINSNATDVYLFPAREVTIDTSTEGSKIETDESCYNHEIHNHQQDITPAVPPRQKDWVGKENRRSEFEEKFKQLEEEKKDTPKNLELQQLNLSNGSVKDRVKNINRMSNDWNVKLTPSPIMRAKKRENRVDKASDDDSSVTSLDPKLRKQWLIKAAQCDYHGLVSLLKEEPKLASLKDFTSTALHWAAKHGNADIIKLIAGKHKINPNIRSGYTAVHLATLYKQRPIVDLLVKTYGADQTIRDYSGKRADQYPDGYISITAGISKPNHSSTKRKTPPHSAPPPSPIPFRSQQLPDSTPRTSRPGGRAAFRTALHQSFLRRPGKRPDVRASNRKIKSGVEVPLNNKRIYVRPLEKEPTNNFIRIGSLNLKVARTAAVFASVRSSARLKTWGSADSVSDSWTTNISLPSKPITLRKRKSKKGSEAPQRKSAVNTNYKHDSDSDSAYGFHS